MKIENGIPMPKTKRSTCQWYEVILKMKVGDSFVANSKNEVSSAYEFGKKRGIKMSARNLHDGTYRVWRIE